MLEQILSEESLKQMADPAFAMVPNKDITANDPKWTKTSTLSLGPIGSCDNTYEYTYCGGNSHQRNTALGPKTATAQKMSSCGVR